jgi:signal transduction histidine kinase
MKRAPFIVALVVTFILEAVLFLFFLGKISGTTQDPVQINDVLYSVADNFGDESLYDRSLSYAVIDTEGEVLFLTDEEARTSIYDAIKHNDTILDLNVDGENVGKVLFRNQSTEILNGYKNRLLIMFLVISFVQIVILILYFLYLKRNITDPFKKMNTFARRVAEGNLDLPLTMDKKHVFGEFTESFDLMRSELKKSKAAEKKANDEKKEMVAKLSHDIKTPIASIKSASEVGMALSKEEKCREYFAQINDKADQVTTLTDNLFNSSINDITEISVNASNYDIRLIKDMIRSSDYKHKADDFTLPEGRVFIDKLRLQQAFDNIFMNSYKYAETKMEVSAEIQGDYLMIRIRDFGPGIPKDELPLITEKYRRGSNAGDKDGAGLGLYLTSYYLEKMDGKLLLEAEDPGLSAIFGLRLVE